MRQLVASTAVFFCVLLSSSASAQDAAVGIVPAQPSARSREPQKCDEACVRANAEKASAICARRIEAQAPGDFEWISRPFTGIFQQADPSKDGQAVATYRGDSIRFLSPQKEWVRVSYECTFDVEKSISTSVRVRPGRIDKPVALQTPASTAKTNNADGAQAAPTSVASAPLAAAIMLAAKHRAAQQTTKTIPQKVRIGEPSAIDISQISPHRGSW